MVATAVRTLWEEPAIDDPPARVWRDWALVALLLPAAILELVLRPELVWPAPSVVVVVVVAITLLSRRTRPLASLAVALGTIAAVELAALASGVEWEGFFSVAIILLFPYALLRWASGKHAEIGLTLMVIHYLVIGIRSANNGGEIIGGAIVFFTPAVIGAAVRYRETAHRRQMTELRYQERELLARELHDTVAHHVSAIAIQAQAGRTLAGTRPEAAVEALAVIEEEASRTLTEMRSIVSALRQGEEPELAPQLGVADIGRLASDEDARPHVDVELGGDLDNLRPMVGAALYRLAQESVTNAIRHARHASRVTVTVTGHDDFVSLTVADDGEPTSGPGTNPGFGLVGMTERAKLLGGTVAAGPNQGRGWTVDAVLPRNGAAR